MPKVSVLMPVYNGALYLNESIDSILNQSFINFEFLIINDGSTDNSAFIINSYSDKRIRYIELKQNSGIINALNLGLEQANGDYIVRMDADDIAAPNRIEKQVFFMDEHPEVAVAGSAVEYFGAKSGIMKVPVTHEEITWSLLFGASFFHPTVILRREILVGLGLYRYPTEYPHAEDYALWAELIGKTKFANLPDALLRYRFNSVSVSARHADIQRVMSLGIRRRVYSRLLGASMNDTDWLAISSENKELVNIPTVINIYKSINDRNEFFYERQFRVHVFLIVKQLILKRGVDLISYWWLIKQLPHDIRFIKYMIISLKKVQFVKT